MITNDRQYQATKVEAANIKKAMEAHDTDVSPHAGLHPLFAKAHRESLESEYEILSKDLADYELLKGGGVQDFEVSSIEDLPIVLISARIARNMTQRELAEAVGLKEQQIQRYEAEEYRSANLPRLYEIARSLNLKISGNAAFVQRSLAAPEEGGSVTIDWRQFPVREMAKRGWFEDFSGSVRDAIAEAASVCELFFRDTGSSAADLVLHKKTVRSISEYDAYALLAWQARVTTVAQRQNLHGSYSKSLITKDWLQKLATLSALDDGPLRAREFLGDVGISLVIEPQLPRTYLDGAAIQREDGTPIIALTTRYDRLDNFWFVLFHELGHVALHMQSNDKSDFFDDSDVTPEGVEEEADRFALDSIIPSEIWESCLSRYSRSVDAIISDASRLNVTPAILAGRIRREAGDYTLFNELVGHGRVRSILKTSDVD